MSIKRMHYDFKKKFNKLDSQGNRNLLVPEIDWALNEAHDIFVALIAEPRLKNHLGFETSQRSIDDIRTIVETACSDPSEGLISLTDDYLYFVRGKCSTRKGNCTSTARLLIKQHDDMFEESPFDRSSFEWQEVTALFNSQGLQAQTDGTFDIDEACITYIRRTPYMHNAEDYRGGTYTLPSGEVLTGFLDCELPEATHREIVDIAVLVASGEIQASDYQLKLNKLKLNQIT